jgi:hypothetical protein
LSTDILICLICRKPRISDLTIQCCDADPMPLGQLLARVEAVELQVSELIASTQRLSASAEAHHLSLQRLSRDTVGLRVVR